MTLRIATRQFPTPITAVSRWSMLIFERRHKQAVEQGCITFAMVDFQHAPQLKWPVRKTGGSRHPVGAGKLSVIEPSPADVIGPPLMPTARQGVVDNQDVRVGRLPERLANAGSSGIVVICIKALGTRKDFSQPAVLQT